MDDKNGFATFADIVWETEIGVCPKTQFIKKVQRSGILDSGALRRRFSGAVISPTKLDESINESFDMTRQKTGSFPPMPPDKTFDKTNTKTLTIDNKKQTLQKIDESLDQHDEETSSKDSMVSEKR